MKHRAARLVPRRDKRRHGSLWDMHPELRTFARRVCQGKTDEDLDEWIAANPEMIAVIRVLYGA